MRILVFSSDSRWVDAVRTAFPSDQDVMAGDPRNLAGLRALLGVVDACFVAETELGSFTVETVKQIAGVTPVPVFAVADTVRPEREEAVLMAGARQVFRGPLRSGIVQLSVSRARAALPAPVASPPPPERPVAPPSRDADALAVLRDFTGLLTIPLHDRRFVSTFVGLVAERLGCGRIALCLRDRSASSGVLQLAFAQGIDARQLESFRIRLDHGLGKLIEQRAGVLVRARLRGDQPDDAMAAREMSVFGAEVAVPLVGNEGCDGVLLVGPRVLGDVYGEQQLTVLFRLMAEFTVMLASAAPERLPATATPTIASLIDALPVGCALLDRSLRMVHANDELRSQLGRESTNPLGIERLPTAWREAIEHLIQAPENPARIELDHELSGVARKMRVTVHRLPAEAGPVDLWLLAAEDITNETRLRQEMHDHSIHNTLQRAGEHLSNEFRNALTPIEVLVQLSGESASGRRDIDRLRPPVSLAIHRLRRRIDNLGYLTKSAIVAELTTVSAVFRSARDRLDHWVEPKQLKTLVWSGEFSKVAFTADSMAVGLALAELVLNAIEAAGGGQVTIAAEDLPEAVNFKVRNPGEWAPPAESSGFGHRPFMTAKSTGVGLGVEVASRVAEFHGGRLVLGPLSPTVVEAVLRIPRNLPVVPTSFETGVARTL